MNILESRTGGSNTPLHICQIPSGKKIVVKQYGFEPIHSKDVVRLTQKQWEPVVKDWFNLRAIIKKCGVNIPALVGTTFVDDVVEYIPTTMAIEYTQLKTLRTEQNRTEQNRTEQNRTVRFVVIEQFCGENVRNLNRTNKLTRDNIEKVKKIITQLPENIEIDTNALNFTIQEQKVYFVDFMPPHISKYKDLLVGKLFKTVQDALSKADFKHKLDSYTTYEGRINKFNGFLENK